MRRDTSADPPSIQQLLVTLLLQRIDQFDRGKKANLSAMMWAASGRRSRSFYKPETSPGARSYDGSEGESRISGD
jgi:hypothetical protein